MSALSLAGRHILVVEDVRFTRTTLAKMLKSFGEPDVSEAEDGVAALETLAAAARPVDCIVTDLAMPRLDGLALLKAIRVGAGDISRAMPVIILTGYSDLERLGSALLLDVDAFLTKPLSRAAIERCLADLFAPGRRAVHQIGAPETYLNHDLSAAVAPATAPELAASPERAIPLADAPEDAVLARDLTFQNGRLLLPAGSRLTGRVIYLLNQIAAVSNLGEELWIAA